MWEMFSQSAGWSIFRIVCVDGVRHPRAADVVLDEMPVLLLFHMDAIV
jgi:hypothetical protein